MLVGCVPYFLYYSMCRIENKNLALHEQLINDFYRNYHYFMTNSKSFKFLSNYLVKIPVFIDINNERKMYNSVYENEIHSLTVFYQNI